MSDDYTPRMKQRFRDELVPALQQELGLQNVMQVPRLDKIVVNMGIGDAVKDGRLLDRPVQAA
jgi:large subunit ribosomal protein L5